MEDMIGKLVNTEDLKRAIDDMQWMEYLTKFPVENQENMFRRINLPKEVWDRKEPKEQFKINQKAIAQLSKQICLNETMTLAMIKEWQSSLKRN